MDASHAYLAAKLPRFYTEDRMRSAAQQRLVREARRQPTTAPTAPHRHLSLWSLVHFRRTYA